MHLLKNIQWRREREREKERERERERDRTVEKTPREPNSIYFCVSITSTQWSIESVVCVFGLSHPVCLFERCFFLSFSLSLSHFFLCHSNAQFNWTSIIDALVSNVQFWVERKENFANLIIEWRTELPVTWTSDLFILFLLLRFGSSHVVVLLCTCFLSFYLLFLYFFFFFPYFSFFPFSLTSIFFSL